MAVGALAVVVMAVLGLAAVVAAPASAVGPELITNGSFEQPAIPADDFLLSNSVPAWTLGAGSTGTGIEIQSYGFSPPDGTQYVEIDSNGPSILYQDIPTLSGRTYQASFGTARVRRPRPPTTTSGSPPAPRSWSSARCPRCPTGPTGIRPR